MDKLDEKQVEILKEEYNLKLIFKDEYTICKESPWYFYNNYLIINGQKTEKVTLNDWKNKIGNEL